MRALPKGWADSIFDDVLLYLQNGIGGKQNKENIGLPVSRIETIATEKIDFNRIGFIEEFDESKISKHKLNKGDILFSHINSSIHLGKTAIFDIDKELYHGINLLRLVVNLATASTYFNYHCKHLRFLGYFSSIAQHAVNQASINQKKLKQSPIILAPLNEQIRIANKLDSLLGKLEATQKRLDKIPTLLKRFRQSVLAAAVSGELTKEWRAQNSLNFDSWSDSTLDEITLSVSDGDHQAPPRANTGIPFLVISNVSSGVIKLNEVSRWVTEEYFSSLKNIRIPKKGDILYTVTGSFGIPVMVVGDEKFCFQRHIAIIKPDKEKIETGFLFRYLQSSNAFEQAKAVATGTAQKTVPLGGLRKFKICYPKPEEQKQIIKRVETLFKLADKVEQQYQAAKQRTDKLTQSILAKAFRGELVLQDPNDEPASELLKRIEVKRKIELETKKRTPQKRVIKSKSQKVKPMTLSDAPKDYLSNLLHKMNNEASAKDLWEQSEMLIDDFYCQLKAEMEKNITEDKASSDPSVRLLKIMKEG